MYRSSSRIALFVNGSEGKDGSREGPIQLRLLPSAKTRWESSFPNAEQVTEPCPVRMILWLAVGLYDLELTHPVWHGTCSYTLASHKVLPS